MHFLLILLPAAVLGQYFSPQHALLARGVTPEQIALAKERFSQLSSSLSPEARIAEQQLIAIARDPSIPLFEKRGHIVRFMSGQSPSVRAELQAVKQQMVPQGFGGLLG